MNELYPFQIEGAKWLTKNRLGLLADEMGLGKSAQVIKACDDLQLSRILILCPAIARVNWLREFEKFSSAQRHFISVTKKDTRISPTPSVVCSYDLVSTLANQELGQFDVVILDESHYVKSTETTRTRAVLGQKGIIRKAKRIWAVSGTPAPNHVGELWPLLYTFGATKLSYDDFVERYCNFYLHNYKRRITGTKLSMVPELKRILEKVMLRRKTEDVMRELPAINQKYIHVEPGEVDLEIDGGSSFATYLFPDQRIDELFADIDDQRELVEKALRAAKLGPDAFKVLEAMAKSVSTLRMYAGLQKINPAAELVSGELLSGAYDKIVIFGVHQGVIEGLRRRLLTFGAVTLYGGTPEYRRQRNIDNFQKDPTCQVLICNIQSAGTAITLTAANQVLFVEQDWVPGNNAQAIKRCHRIGQAKPVFVRYLTLPDTVDELVSQTLKRKTKELLELFGK